MKDELAERLLARVMGWKSPAEFVEHGLPLQTLAAYKYDEYQQFSPGMRFVESLALWLGQFETIEQRQTALRFVKDRLVYLSSAEMNHLVAIAYPDHIRPFLLSRAAAEAGLSRWHLGRIASSGVFRARERRSLFLGLSDGSRTDVFRRANPHLHNEQIRQSHELSNERVEDLKEELAKGLEKIHGTRPAERDAVFQSVVLLDDFSASGISYIRTKAGGTVAGKVGKFVHSLKDDSERVSSLFTTRGLEIILVLYMATESAETILSERLAELCRDSGYVHKVLVVQRFPEARRIRPGSIPELDKLIESYYDDENESTSTALGGTDLKYGFAGCGLPLILSHNTPNNSLGLLWAEGPKMRPLFPRITRHKDK